MTPDADGRIYCVAPNARYPLVWDGHRCYPTELTYIGPEGEPRND